MSIEPLRRIPFGAADELTILSTARWMRFMAVVTIIGAFLTLFVVMVAIVFASFAPIPASVRIGKGPSVLVINQVYLAVAAVAALAMASVNFYIGAVLYQAAEDFERVARTDLADQAFLARGLARLKRYFQVFVVVAALSVVVALAIAATFLTRASAP